MTVQPQKPSYPLYLLLTSLFIVFTAFLQSSFATNPCITLEKETALRSRFPKQYGTSKDAFEQWMTKKIALRQQHTTHQKQGTTTRIIPIIFHIINGCETIGTGTNVTASLIQAQLNQLNADFRKQNEDFDGSWSQAADTDIEFCLATVDQNNNCLPEAGIIRWDNWGAGPHDDDFIDANIKPTSIQDPSRFLNFWVLALQPGLLGYAQFPDSNPTGDGSLTFGSHAAATDGVVCTYTAIGSLDYPNPADPTRMGRTATHEVGHWLGLRHIWGDGDCSVDDYCSDTPSSEFANVNCTPTAHCGTQDMIQNYMDYTSDACRNMFTTNQKLRMDAVLNFSNNRPFTLNGVPTVCQPSTIPSASFVTVTTGNSSSSVCNTGSLLNSDFATAHLCLDNNNTITFTDKSTCSPNSWNWTFEGGTPNTYNGQTPPSITYNSVGAYDVTLQACNGTDCDVYTINNAVNVYSGANCNNACGSVFTDNGGKNNNYNNNENSTWTFCPAYPSTQITSVDFTHFDVESNADCSWDYLEVFDGETTTDQLLGTYCGTTLPNGGTVAANNAGGCLTFRFISDASTNKGGWEALVNCVERPSCGDGLQNGDETGVDCGGSNCPACPTCGTTFTDNGGTDNNYANDESSTYVLCPDEPTCQGLSITFTNFSLESSLGSGANGTGCWDYLEVFDGPNDASPTLGAFCGNTLADAPGGGSSLTSTHTSGCLTFVFTSDDSNTSSGWIADVSCTNTCPCTSDADCDDGDNCTIDSCDAVAGCLHTPDPICNCSLDSDVQNVKNTLYYNTYEITVLNGQKPYTYDWDVNSTVRRAIIGDEQLRLLCTNDAYWFVTVTDANGCTHTVGSHTTDPTNMLQISDAQITHDVCLTDDLEGAINITVTGGASSDYTYDWQGPTNAPNLTGTQLTGLPTGWYLVEICDTDGDGVCDALDEMITAWYWVPCSIPSKWGKTTTSQKVPEIHAYPNPFQSNTTIEFTATYTGMATVSIFDWAGYKVTDLFKEKAIKDQSYRISFEEIDLLNTGIYVAQFTQADGTKTQEQLLFIK